MTKVQVTTLEYRRPDSPRGKCYFAVQEIDGEYGLVGWGGGDTPGQFKPYDAKAVAKKVREKQAEGYEVTRSFEIHLNDHLDAPGAKVYDWCMNQGLAAPVAPVASPVASLALPVVSAQLCDTADIADLEMFVRDDAWAMERKYDGHRVMVRVVDNVPTFLNRTGAEYGHGVSSCVRNAFSAHLAGEWLFDGELIGDDYYAYDLLMVGGIDMRSQPWIERRMALTTAITAMSLRYDCIHLSEVAFDAATKTALVKDVVESGGEGFVVKRLDRQYQGGRVSHWRKIKWVSTADVIVTETRRQGKDSIGMGLFRDGKLVSVGACNMQGKVDRMNALVPGDVVEVRYLYSLGATNGFKLVQPEFLGKRDDKDALDCTVDQLRVAVKKVG